MEFKQDPGRFYQTDEQGRTVAEVTFPLTEPGVMEINHTFVDESLRGQGVAGKLILAVASYAKEHGMKIVPTCSYAVKWFKTHPEYRELLK